MTISKGARLPDAQVIKSGESGFETIGMSDYLAGRKIVLFALPGAYTGDCSTIHMPSFVRSADAIRAKGVDEIICLSVNDPFVMTAWGEDTGATAAGITMLADSTAELTLAVDMAFTAPPVGLHNRSSRYAVILEDGVITHAEVDDPGVCDMTRGENLLEALG